MAGSLGSSASVQHPISGLNAGGANLAEVYRNLQSDLVSKGLLRTDARAKGASWTTQNVIDNFINIAMFSEYNGHGGFAGSSSKGVLRRWVEPVRMNVIFGASVSEKQRKIDTRRIGQMAGNLSKVTGHPMGMSRQDPNFFVLVVGDAERRNLSSVLDRIAPDLGRSSRKYFLNMPPNILCMVLAQPNIRAGDGYKRAIVLVRAEHPPRMRESCIQEEMAQAMGLPNDSPKARPSIFNDDEEFAVLTHHDAVLLRILYDQRLKPGMTIKQLKPLLPTVARSVMAGS